MITQPAEYLTPLEGIIGRWRSSGSVLDEDGSTVVATISGTDVYSWASSGNWIVHDVDVLMGDERTLVTELIVGATLTPAAGRCTPSTRARVPDR